MDTVDLSIFAPADLGNRIHVYGRTSAYNKSLVLFWTASGFAVETTAGEVWAEIEADFSLYEPWVSVWVDGAMVSRFMPQKGRAWYCLMRGLGVQKEVHRIALLKETQAMSADDAHICIVHSIGLPKGVSLEAFCVPKLQPLNIEFIGDSITTGEGLCGATQEMDWIPAWMSLKDNYAVRTAQKLGADFRILSQSGWGVSTSWDNDPGCALPRYYDKVCGLAFGEKNARLGAQNDYDFSLWQPHIIVVNLGTNDWGAFNAPPKTLKDGSVFKLHLEQGVPVKEDVLFVQEKIAAFLEVLHQKNPKAHIMWSYGMVSLDFSEHIRDAVEAFAKKWKHVSFLPLCPMSEESEEEKGSRSHPGPGTHKRASERLTKEITALLGTL